MDEIINNDILSEIDQQYHNLPTVYLIAVYNNNKWVFMSGHCNSFKNFIIEIAENEYYDSKNRIPKILPLILMFSENTQNNNLDIDNIYKTKIKNMCLNINIDQIKPSSDSYEIFLDILKNEKGILFKSKKHHFSEKNVFNTNNTMLYLWIEKPMINMDELLNYSSDEDDLICSSLRISNCTDVSYGFLKTDESFCTTRKLRCKYKIDFDTELISIKKKK
jgi:hypothetical protein